MAYYDALQQNPIHNPQFNPQQWATFNPQNAQYGGFGISSPQMQGLGQGLGYGQGQAAYGGQQFGGGVGQGWGAQPQWSGQRQLSQQDVSEVVRQLLPALPHILAQAQQPHGALGYAAYGQQQQRLLTQQDVNEVVRQLLPILPQIVGALQGQPQWQQAAMYGGAGPWGQLGFGNSGGQFPFAALTQQQPLGQFGPQFQAAFGGASNLGQRQLTQQDVADVTRQLAALIPQVIGNLQAFNQNQQRMN
jgi:hypothetical protein